MLEEEMFMSPHDLPLGSDKILTPFSCPSSGRSVGVVVVDHDDDDDDDEELNPVAVQGQRKKADGVSQRQQQRPYDPYTTSPSKMMSWVPPSMTTTTTNPAVTDASHLHYRQNFGKDGLYVSPATTPTRAPSSRLAGTATAPAPTGAGIGTGASSLNPKGDVVDDAGRQSSEDLPRRRPSENDRPFDQPPSDDDDNDSGIRDLLTVTSMRALKIISPASEAAGGEAGGTETTMSIPMPTTPPRVTRTATADALGGLDCDAVSTYSPQSTKIESVWLSSPEASPKGTYQAKALTHSQMGLFTVPPPKISDPGRLDERLLNLERQQEIARQRIDAQTMRVYQIGVAAVTPSRDEQEQMMMMMTTTTATTTTPAATSAGTQGQDQYSEADGGDTLFDFVEKEESNEVLLQKDDSNQDDLLNKNIRVTHRVRRKIKQRRQVQAVALDPVSGINVPVIPTMMETEDDTSTEHYGVNPASPTNLQQRAHQAWKSRQKKNSSIKSKQQQDGTVASVIAAPVGADEADGSKMHRSNVSFGKSDTVHHFETETTNGEDTTLCERSLTSEYTKTMESEVEDMIKDLMLIGDGRSAKPGRRQFKHKPAVKRKLRNQAINCAGDSLPKKADSVGDDDDDQPSYLPAAFSSQVLPVGTAKNSNITTHRHERGRSRSRPGEESQDETADESTISADDTMTSDSQLLLRRGQGGGDRPDDRSIEESTIGSATIDTFLTDDGKKTRITSVDDPFAAVLDFMEGGFSAVSSAIEYAMESAAQQTDGSSKKQRGNGIESLENDFLSALESCNGKNQVVVGPGNVDSLSRSVANVARDSWFGPYLDPGSLLDDRRMRSKRSFDEQEKTVDNSLPDSSNKINYEHTSRDDKQNQTRRMLALGSGDEVAKLAVHSAHSVHRMQGIEYDDSVAIDMYNDLKISEVLLTLPLGIVFMENDGGCFVTKVSPDGSAARSGGVEVGDQLASINGKSAVDMKVDDVFNAVSNWQEKKHVDLVFMRYVGPFRPAERDVSRKSSFSERSRTMTRGVFGRKKEMTVNPATLPTPSEPGLIAGNAVPKKKVPGFRFFGLSRKNKTTKETKTSSNKGK